MAHLGLPAAKVVLLAVQAASNSDIDSLRILASQYRKTLSFDLILRILLTFLPESLESSEYVPFLVDLSRGSIHDESNNPIDSASVNDITDVDASKRVRKLHLLPLARKSVPADVVQDPLVHFLIHRAYRIDENTGLIAQLPSLIVPFLDRSQYLRTWMISTLLPLLRLSYEYYPTQSAEKTIEEFESLEDRIGVEILLSHTGKNLENNGDPNKTVGRDMKGLLGPWMYGDARWKRRKLRRASSADAQTILALDQAPPPEDHKCAAWEEVFKWITLQATKSWITCVQVIDQWDGPGDVDLGGYGDGTVWLDEKEQQFLEKRYARAALAGAYLIPEASEEALAGAQHILGRIAALLDYDQLPSLQAAAALLSPIRISDDSILSPNNATQLRTGLLKDSNPLTAPQESSTLLLQGLVVSAFLLTRAGVQCTIRRAGELALLQDEADQMAVLQRLITKVNNGPKGDDKYWIRMRSELLWLRNWGFSSASSETAPGKGVFGKVKKELIEIDILTALLSNTRYTLASSIYETSKDKPLSKQQVQHTIITAAMKAFDNATNANRTRGGVKKCDDILQAFPDSLGGTAAEARCSHLVKLSHLLGQYRLVLREGEPFAPVILRVHSDPISIIGKVLDQNPRVYTRIQEMLQLGELMVLAGLTIRNTDEHAFVDAKQDAEQILISKRRVTAMCVDAALAEDDFETAYSYIMTRLAPVAKEAQTRLPRPDARRGRLAARLPPTTVDNWSWKVAFQAGKYKMNENTVRPTHVGNASFNREIRHLEQRMDCLSLSLRIAPPENLQMILNAYRRCEEELDTKTKEEAEQEDAWDEAADQSMPGAFGPDTTANKSRAGISSSKGETEAPMSIFELSRATAARVTSLASSSTKPVSVGSALNPDDIALRHNVSPAAVRKRDQLSQAATGFAVSAMSRILGVDPAKVGSAEER